MTDVTIVKGATQVSVNGVTLNVLTTTERDALTAEEGMIIFNSTTDQVEEYDGAVWEAVGQVILDTHAALRTAIHGIVLVRLSADHTLDSNSTTLQNVTNLVLALAANEVWRVECLFIIDSSAVADAKVGFTIPSGATFDGRSNHTGTGGSTGTATIMEASSNPLSVFGGGAGSPGPYYSLTGVIVNSTTAGNFQVQAAQDTAEVSTSKIGANSYIIATRLA